MSASKSTRPVNTDGANFSKGPSKPVPLNPRSRPLNSMFLEKKNITAFQLID